MGVTDLWRVLSRVAEKVQLEDLEGQTVAVDLSGWIVESRSVKHNTPNGYIRNLFFRCRKLLRHGIKLVFVLEGESPEVKMDTLSQRSRARFGEAEPRKVSAHRAGLRTLSMQCQELLEILGLPCIQSPGEAECTCAFLNKQKMVDACMTQDGDAFLYGAATVYRKLNIEDKDPHVLAYKMADIESKLGLNREKLIALAVLSGCDYSSGLQNVGKETALKFLHSLQHVDVIERLRSWFMDKKYETLEKKVDAVVKKDSHCTHCQHLGTRSSHQTNGCEACDTKRACHLVQPESADCKCEWHEQSAIKQKWKLELELRRKAKQVKTFPPEDVIREFLNKNDKVERVDVAWTRPKTSQFESFMSNTLRWKGQDSRDNLFPVLTCWHLRSKNDDTRDTGLMPIRIVKERVVQGADFFEVEWQAEEFEGTPPTTTEPQKLFEEKYPEMVRCYNEKLDQLRRKKVTEPKNKDIREFFRVSAKNRNGKELVGDTTEKEKTAIEPSPAHPSESRGRRVTRARKPKPAVKQTKPVVTLGRYFEKTSVEKEEESLNSSLDEFSVPLSQRIQKEREKAKTAATTTTQAVGKAEERKTKSPRKSSKPNAFTISLSDSLKQGFAEESPSWPSTNDEAEENALYAGCTPPKRRNASYESKMSRDAGEPDKRKSGRRRLSFDTPPSTPFAEASQRGSETPTTDTDTFPTQSTPVSFLSQEEGGSSVIDDAFPFEGGSCDQSAPLFDSMASLEGSPSVIKAVHPSVIEISDDDC